jgi:hypothetical protein
MQTLQTRYYLGLYSKESKRVPIINIKKNPRVHSNLVNACKGARKGEKGFLKENVVTLE